MEDREILEKMIDLAKRTGMDMTLANKIENLLKENENLKQAIKINKREYQKVCNENKELKKYDIRNIKLGDDKILKSPSFTKEEIDLMNLGIALSTSFDVLFNDESEE